MAKVVKMKGRKELDVYKIEGEGFEKIRTFVMQSDKLFEEKRALEEQIIVKAKAIREGLWEAIYTEVGKELKNNYSLNSDYASLGFYLVEKRKHRAITNLLENLGGYRG